MEPPAVQTEAAASIPSVADLAIRDIFYLVKKGIAAEFVCILFFGLTWALPHALFSGLGGWTENLHSPQWAYVLGWGAVLVAVARFLPDLLEGFGRIATQLAPAVKKTSLLKRLLLLSLIAGLLFLDSNSPDAFNYVFFFVLLPLGYVYDEYRNLLRKKLPDAKSEVAEEGSSTDQ